MFGGNHSSLRILDEIFLFFVALFSLYGFLWFQDFYYAHMEFKSLNLGISDTKSKEGLY